MEDNKRKLYDALSEDYDLGSFEQFSNNIADETKRRKLYDATIEEYDFGDYDTFSKKLGFGLDEEPEKAEKPVSVSRSVKNAPSAKERTSRFNELARQRDEKYARNEEFSPEEVAEFEAEQAKEVKQRNQETRERLAKPVEARMPEQKAYENPDIGLGLYSQEEEDAAVAEYMALQPEISAFQGNLEAFNEKYAPLEETIKEVNDGRRRLSEDEMKTLRTQYAEYEKESKALTDVSKRYDALMQTGPGKQYKMYTDELESLTKGQITPEKAYEYAQVYANLQRNPLFRAQLGDSAPSEDEIQGRLLQAEIAYLEDQIQKAGGGKGISLSDANAMLLPGGHGDKDKVTRKELQQAFAAKKEELYANPWFKEYKETNIDKNKVSNQEIGLQRAERVNQLRDEWQAQGISPQFYWQMEKGDEELQRLDAAAHMHDDAIREYEKPTKYEAYNKNVTRGLKGWGEEMATNPFGMVGFTEDVAVVRPVLEKVEKLVGNLDQDEIITQGRMKDLEEQLTPGELAVLDAWFEKVGAQAAVGADTAIGYQIGSGIGDMIQLGVEMVLTGGIGGAAKEGTEALLKRKMIDWLGKRAYRKVAQNGFGKVALWTTSKVISDVAETVVRLPFMPSTYKAIGEGAVEVGSDYKLRDVTDYAPEKMWGQFVEQLTEVSNGFAFPLINKVVKLPGMQKYITGILGDDAMKVMKAFIERGDIKLLDDMMIGGFGGEWEEELLGAIINSVSGDKNALKDFFSAEQQLVLLGTLAPLPLARGAAGGISLAVPAAKADISWKRAEAELRDLGFDEGRIARIKEVLDNAAPAEGAREVIQALRDAGLGRRRAETSVFAAMGDETIEGTLEGMKGSAYDALARYFWNAQQKRAVGLMGEVEADSKMAEKDSEIRQNAGSEYTHTDGEGNQVVERATITGADGNPMKVYIVSDTPNAEGKLAYVSDTGVTGFISEEELAKTGTTVTPKNRYLAQLVMADSQVEEAEGVVEDANALNQTIRQQVEQLPELEYKGQKGTIANPGEDGAMFVPDDDSQEVTFVSWADLASQNGIPVPEVLTKQEKEGVGVAQVAARYQAQQDVADTFRSAMEGWDDLPPEVDTPDGPATVTDIIQDTIDPDAGTAQFAVSYPNGRTGITTSIPIDSVLAQIQANEEAQAESAEEAAEEVPVEEPVVEEKPKIPVDKKGNPIYDAPGVSVDDALEAMYDTDGLTPEQARQYVDGVNKFIIKRAEEAEKGRTPEQGKMSLPELKKAIVEANRVADFWQEAKRFADRLVRDMKKEDDLRKRIEELGGVHPNDLEPRTMEEALADALYRHFRAGYKLKLQSVLDLVGSHMQKDLRKLGYGFVLSNKQGALPIDKFVMGVADEYPGLIKDDQDAIHMVADLIMSHSRGELGTFILEARQKELAEAKEHEEPPMFSETQEQKTDKPEVAPQPAPAPASEVKEEAEEKKPKKQEPAVEQAKEEEPEKEVSEAEEESQEEKVVFEDEPGTPGNFHWPSERVCTNPIIVTLPGQDRLEAVNKVALAEKNGKWYVSTYVKADGEKGSAWGNPVPTFTSSYISYPSREAAIKHAVDYIRNLVSDSKRKRPGSKETFNDALALADQLEKELPKEETKEQKAERKRAEKLTKRADKWKEKIGDVFVVLKSREELEAIEDEKARKDALEALDAGNRIGGFYRNGKAYIYLPGMYDDQRRGLTDQEVLDRTIIHEVITHKGLEGLLGKERFAKLCDSVWENVMDEASRADFLEYVGEGFKSEQARRRAAANEFMAHLSEESNLADEIDKTAWQKFVELVKEFIGDLLGKDFLGKDTTFFEQLLRESMNRFVLENGKDGAVGRLNDMGIAANEEEALFSRRFVPTKAQEKAIVDDIVRTTGISRERAKRWVKSETSVAAIVGDMFFAPYLDYEADDRYEAIKKDSDYPQGTVDFNNVCRKRLAFTRMYQKIQQAFPYTIITGEDLANIRQIMKDHGLTVACGLCYVEDRRQLLGEIAKGFIEEMRGNFENYAKGSETKQKNAEKFRGMLGDDRKEDLSIYDLITLDGSKKLSEEHPGIYAAFQAFNAARGQQSGNLFQGYAEYKREILKWSKAKVKSVNENGGLRIFSYSDFEAHHLLDIVQIIQDCARKGVMIQGYTKVPAFARAVAMTGAKINRSLIPLGDTGIVDGKLAYDPVEGIDVNDKDFLESNDNIGNVLIGINDEQIRLAMADPFVHYIIPYHSNQSGLLRKLKQTGAWTNYKNFQTDKGEGVGKHGVNIYTDVLAAAEKEGKPIKTEKQFTEKFLAVCKERGWKPRFAQFLDTNEQGEYVYTPGYYKLLLDFKLFDEKGRILPQKPVKADFDDAFLKTILEDYVKGEQEKYEGDIDAVYDEIVEKLGLNEREEDVTHFSRSNRNQEIFVSNAASALAKVKMDKATPEQWQKMLEKEGGLKAGEDKWMGLSDFLKSSDRKTLTKEEIADYIDEHKIQIEETNYFEELADEDGRLEMVRRINDRLDELNKEFDDIDKVHDALLKEFPDIDKDVEDGVLKIEEDSMGGFYYAVGDSGRINSTRLSYTTDGLDNKREIALTVPTIESWNEKDQIHFGDAGNGRSVAWIRFGDTIVPDEEADRATREHVASIDALDSFKDSMKEKHGGEWEDKMSAEEKTEYDRLQKEMDDAFEKSRTSYRHNKVLVIDEIQSKRHQEARERGYSRKQTPEEIVEEANTETRYRELVKPMIDKYGAGIVNPGNFRGWPEVTEEDRATMEEAESLRQRVQELKDIENKGVPEAPFEKNWHELAMKRMLRYAAENGYDYVAWTKGDQQAERYNIGRIVDTFDSERDPVTGNQKIDFVLKNAHHYIPTVTVDPSGNIIEDEGLGVKGNTLASVVGKDLAERLMKPTESERIKTDEVSFGGEGMRGFYDDILPRFMNKYGKKWGVKVGDITLPYVEEAGLTMHAVPVTQEMKESVMEGQTMFSKSVPGNPLGELEDDVTLFKKRTKPAPQKTGIGYKVFFRGKDGNLYPPMVNPTGEPTPVGEWLDAEEGIAAPDSKTGRKKVKAGGKGTQGGGGTLAYRPGWHLGEIPYALQFNRGEKVDNPLGITNQKGEVIKVGKYFPKDFVWGEVEYAMDNDYQEEAMSYGYNKNGNFEHAKAGLPRIPVDGSYKYRTNANPATDPWIITGAMKVNRILTNEEVDEIVRKAGREPQLREEGENTLFSRNPETLTENFKKFFGDWVNDPENASKVVDENGEPMVVYHGSRATSDFDSFDYDADTDKSTGSGEKPAFFFTDEDSAKTYSSDVGLGTLYRGDGRIVPAYISIKNPMVVDYDGANFRGVGLQAEFYSYVLKKWMPVRNTLNGKDLTYFATEGEIIQQYWETHPNSGRLELDKDYRFTKVDVQPHIGDVVDGIDRSKYDGAIIKNIWETGRAIDDYVAFDPKQIKHATENNGDYNPDDERMRFSKSSENLSSPFERAKAVDRLNTLAKNLGVGFEQDAKMKGKGAYKGGNVRINIDAHESTPELEATLLHEAVGNEGLNKLSGGAWKTVREELYGEAAESVKAEVDAIAKADKLSSDAAMEQFIAQLAEEGFVNEDERTLWQKIVDAVKTILQRLGFGTDYYTDQDYRAMLYGSYANQQKGGALETAERVATYNALRRSAELSHEDIGPEDNGPEGGKSVSDSSESRENDVTLSFELEELPSEDFIDGRNGKQEGLRTKLAKANELLKSLEKDSDAANQTIQEIERINQELSARKQKQDEWREKYHIGEDGKISFDDLSALFNDYNQDEDVAALFEKVAPLCRKIGLDIRFNDTLENSGESHYDGKVRYHLDFLTATGTPAYGVGTTILHELVHSVTQSTVYAYNNGLELTSSQRRAVKELMDTYDELLEQAQGFPIPDYAENVLSSAEEMIAEMADPYVREELSKIPSKKSGNILRRIIDAIRSLFVGKADNMNDKVARALDKIIGQFSLDTFEAVRQDVSDYDWDSVAGSLNKPIAPLPENERDAAVDNEDGTLFSRARRRAIATTAADVYETRAANVWQNLRSQLVDEFQPVIDFLRAVLNENAVDKKGRPNPYGRSLKGLKDDEMVVEMLREVSGKAMHETRRYDSEFIRPMWKAVGQFRKAVLKSGQECSFDDMVRYVMLKSGLERNIQFAKRDAKRDYQDQYDARIAEIDEQEKERKKKLDKDLKDGKISDVTYQGKLTALQQEKAQKRAEAKAKLDARLNEVDLGDNGTDPVYKEYRKKDYSGLMTWFREEPDIKREDYPSTPAYNRALAAAHETYTNGVTDLASAEAEAGNQVARMEGLAGRGKTDELWKRINAATKETLDFQFKHGMLTRQQVADIAGTMKYYVPMRGFADQTAEDLYTYYLTANQSGFAPTVLSAEGRTSRSESPFGMIAFMHGSATAQGLKNEAKIGLLNFVRRHPENGIATVTRSWFVKTGEQDADGNDIYEAVYPTIPEGATFDERERIIDQFEKDMADLRDQGEAYNSHREVAMNKGVVAFERDSHKNEHVVKVNEFGREYGVIFSGNPAAAQAINGLSKRKVDDYLAAYDGIRRGMSGMFTTYSPLFWITNFQRDTGQGIDNAFIRNNAQYWGKYAKSWGRSVFRVFPLAAGWEKLDAKALGKLDPKIADYYKEFVENGGPMGQNRINDNTYYERRMKRYIKFRQYEKANALNAGLTMLEILGSVGEAIETLTRFTAFVASRESGRPIHQSISDAKEISTNFARRGRRSFTWDEIRRMETMSGRKLNKAEAGAFQLVSWMIGFFRHNTIFFNAAVQGIDNLRVNFAENPLKTSLVIGTFAAIGFAKMFLGHGGGGDDESEQYGHTSDYLRRNNDLIPLGDGRYLKIALPQEYRWAYAMGDVMASAIMHDRPADELVDDAFSSLMEVLPVGVFSDNVGLSHSLAPSILTPLIETSKNKNFMGSRIYNEGFNGNAENDPGWTKAIPSTGEGYVQLAQYLNRVSGGGENNDVFKGDIDINPAILEHWVEGYLSGPMQIVNGVTRAVRAADRGEKMKTRDKLFINRLILDTHDNDRDAYYNDLYYYFKEYDKEAKRIDSKLKDRQADGSKQVEDFYVSKMYRYMEVFKEYESEERHLNKVKKGDDEDAVKEAESEVNRIHREVAERCMEIYLEKED